MSPQYSIFLLLVFVVLATATNIPPPPAETIKSLTGPPASIITPAPSDVDLQKRIIATCGFVRGDSASPITCPGGYNCVATMKAALQFACCNNVECLGNYGICRQYGEKGCMGYTFGDDTCESIYGSILQCSEESPYCFRYALSSSRGATNTYYSLGCATTSEDVLLLDSATNAAVKTKAADPTQQGGVANPLTSLYSIPGMASPPEPTFGSSSSNPPAGNPSKSILSTTAIVAISVVGACVLLVALFFIWCCWRRNSRRNMERIRPKIVEPAYAHTVTQGPGPGSILAWNEQTPLGSNPEIARSETGSQWSGPTATAQRRPMNTVYEY